MSPARNWTLGIALIVPLMGGLATSDHWPAATPAIATTPPAVRHYGDPADTLYQQARAALNRGDNRQAARLFHRIVEEEPDSEYAPDALYWQAFALYRVGGNDALREALSALDQQREEYPDAATRGDADALAVRIRGALAQGGDADAAQRLYEVAGEAESGYDVEAGDCPDEDSDVRVAALNALMEMDPERALPVLEKVLARRDACSETLREKAIFIVAEGESPRATDILLEVARTDPHPEVRGQAVFWLSEVEDERAVDALEQILLESQDNELREKALFALSENDSERAGQILRSYALDPGQPEEVREKALFWYAESQSGGDVAFLRELYGRVESESLKEKVLFAASESGDPEAVEWLLEIAGDGSQSIELRKQALFWAGESSEETGDTRLLALYDRTSEPELKHQLLFVYSELDTPDSIDKLFQIARTETDPELRKQALFWLGESGDPRVPQFLEELISQ
ncbi:MAG TPA: HEAT repeat domain-containing protein [Gemmatimonadota bacterium]|nr:HEAT repeat domain-containing protein [Gemmatimonadota bacterium]